MRSSFSGLAINADSQSRRADTLATWASVSDEATRILLAGHLTPVCAERLEPNSPTSITIMPVKLLFNLTFPH